MGNIEKQVVESTTQETQATSLLPTSNVNFGLQLFDRASVEKALSQAFINRESAEWEIACSLYVMYTNQFYKKGTQDGFKCYTKFDEWAKETYGLAKATAYQYKDCFVWVADYKTVDTENNLKGIVFKSDLLKGFTVTKIADMLPLLKKWKLERIESEVLLTEKITPYMTRKEIKEIVTTLLDDEKAIDSTAREVEETEENTETGYTNKTGKNASTEPTESGVYTIITINSKDYRLTAENVSKLEKWFKKEKIEVIE